MQACSNTDIQPSGTASNASASLPSVKVHLNPFFAEHLSSDGDRQALMRKFATFAPGPVLFKEAEEVSLHLIEDKHNKHYQNRKGQVLAHNFDNPRVVRVRLDPAGTKPAHDVTDVTVLYTCVRPVGEKQPRCQRTRRMLESLRALAKLRPDSAAGGGPDFHVLGCIQFEGRGPLEREYWIALSPLTCSFVDDVNTRWEMRMRGARGV